MVRPFQIPALGPRSTNPAVRPGTQRSSSSSCSTVTEALKTNPFATSRSRDTLKNSETDVEPERTERNEELLILIRLFPDIKAEVHRELLMRFDGDSRLEVCAEQLLRHRDEWVKGRLKVPPLESTEILPREEYFRPEAYKSATRTTLVNEFKSLSRSTIEAVLAEENFAYSRVRPKLKDLSKKTWRATLNNLNIFRKRKEKDDPPSSLIAQTTTTDLPVLKDTNCDELNAELRNLYISPILEKLTQEQETSDQTYAEELNQEEAEEADALCECQVCYNDAPFENVSHCSYDSHVVCFDCIRHTMQEALFGQGWEKSIDTERSTLKCIAPLANGTCEGFLSVDVTKRAIKSSKSGNETYRKFEDQLASRSLTKTQIQLIHCPFCPYAEADPNIVDHNTPIPWHINPSCPLLLLLILLPLLLIYLLSITLLSLLLPTQPPTLFQSSLHRLLSTHLTKHLSPRFTCLSPLCSRRSCLKCLQPWHDPHACHSGPLLQSLHTTVEAARTSALKRTCPRCGLSFIKASGCNKLTCVCGYAMCYLCRKALVNPTSNPRIIGARRAEDENEGYRHFCEHFRPVPGRACTQCTKCDLYRVGDEEAAVREAGEKAEREWREREGMVGVEGFGRLPGDEGREKDGGREGLLGRVLRGKWSRQGVMDWVVEKVVKVEAG
ncbi:MAG: hypothetical protein Q9160_001353 [Pyrenula sp. 1 TL-2023]